MHPFVSDFRRRAGLASFALLLALLLPGLVAAAPTSFDGLWREVDALTVERSAEPRRIEPAAYRSFALDRARLDALLEQTPREADVPAAASDTTLWLPMADGRYERFMIVESPIMEAGLAERYPQFRTYLGQGIDDPTATLRFDLTHLGFRAQVLSSRGTTYIDPLQPGDTTHYMAYRKADHRRDGDRMRCGVDGSDIEGAGELAKHLGMEKISSGATLRTYRLAMAATGEYTGFHGGTVADGMAAILTTMNRVNGIYERELSVRMVLVANNDLVVFTNPATDPYTNNNGSTMLNQNQTTLDSIIGSANYDIGHVVSTGGGGVAQLRSVCSSSGKARGVTGSPQPTADAFDVDYVAHEMGHQFGGNHTYNGAGCGGGRSTANAYEPGSGITIQAYAGICGSDNLQGNSEDYFHRTSLNEMLAFINTASTGGSCGSTSATGNGIPVVSTPAAFTIPRQTPFTLSASGSDPDGDTLTYLWEQFDLGPANNAGSLTDNGGPLFRSFAPLADPIRTLPSLRYILDNANVPPAQAPLPGTATPNRFTGELLPNTNRTVNFRVTVRDNRAGGGGTNEAATALTVTTAAGPFAVTAPNSAVVWDADSPQTVTWAVANTDSAPVNVANVRITLSLDGGYTWPIELAASAPNTGTADIIVPAGTPSSTQARVRVEALENIFFDVSDVNFGIIGENSPPSVSVTGSVTTRQGSPTATAVVASASDLQDPASALEVLAEGAPVELLLSASNANGQVSLSATAECTLVAPTSGNRVYPVQLRVTDTEGAATAVWVNVNVGANLTPQLGTYANLTLGRNQSASATPSSAPSDGNGNLDSLKVSPTTLPGGGSISISGNGVVSIQTTPSTAGGVYPLLVSVEDTCGAVEQKQFELTVDASDRIFGDGFE